MVSLRAYIIVVFLHTTACLGFAAPAKGNLAVSAYITSEGRCSVDSTKTTNIAFGTLNPLNPVDVQASGSIVVRCQGFGRNPGPGSGNSFTVGVTQATASPLTLKSGSNTITYTLELPTSVTSSQVSQGWKIFNLTIPITADIQGVNYKTAPAGNYTSTVTLQVSP